MGGDSGAARKATVVRKEVVASGFLRVERAEVRHSRYDGGEAMVTRESVERGDSSAVLMVDWRASSVRLVEQFRYPTLSAGEDGWLVELPAGMVDAGETPADAARRETLEEVGVACERLEPIASVYPSPGACSERVHLFYADVTGATVTAPTPDPTEDIRVILEPIEGFLAAARAGRLRDAKALVAGLWLLAHRERLQPRG